jgi:hypothetical protein
MRMRHIICCLAIRCVGLVGLVALPGLRSEAQAVRIVVDASGHGDFRTIQEAINSLPDDSSETRVIFIRKGIYHEQVFIEKSNVDLEGEDKDQTIISFPMARDAWRCDHPDDWGVATLNLRGSEYIRFRSYSCGGDDRVCGGFGLASEAGEPDGASDGVAVVRDDAVEGDQLYIEGVRRGYGEPVECECRDVLF